MHHGRGTGGVWKVPAPWTAQNAAHRALENRRQFSTPPTRVIVLFSSQKNPDQRFAFQW
jgi:hypothetical protein